MSGEKYAMHTPKTQGKPGIPGGGDREMKKLDIIAAALLMVGGLNWGLVGLFQFDLVQALIGSWAPALANLVYIIVGLSAVYQAATWKAIQKRWREMEIPVRFEPAPVRSRD